MKQLLSFILMAAGLAGNGYAQTETASCYVGELAASRPATIETVVSLVDTSTDPTLVRQAYLDVIQSVPETVGRHIVVLSYANHSPTEALKKEFEALVEPPLTDQKIIDDTIIKTFKQHQKCIRDQHAYARSGLTKTLHRLLDSMPITTSKSEIAYAEAGALQAYVRPERSLILLHLSDGMQHAQKGRSFYGSGKLPRKIDPAIELKAFASDPATAPRAKPQGSYVSVLWWGMLTMPTPQKKGKGADKVVPLDTATISAFTSFWEQYSRSLGVDRVQIGAPNLLNPDLSVPKRQPQ